MWRQNHRGPYRLFAGRPYVKRESKREDPWLAGLVDADDVESEARAILADPRDTVHAVHVWSEREGQFVMTFNGRS